MSESDPYDLTPKSKLTGFIPDKLYDIVEQDPIDDKTKVVSELASRLLDLKEIDSRLPIVLLHSFQKLLRISPSGLWTTLEILAGGRGLDKSLSERGKEFSFSKQAIHQKQQRDLTKISEQMPEIAEALSQILGRKIKGTGDGKTKESQS